MNRSTPYVPCGKDDDMLCQKNSNAAEVVWMTNQERRTTDSLADAIHGGETRSRERNRSPKIPSINECLLAADWLAVTNIG
jgi:hypothetical protein